MGRYANASIRLDFPDLSEEDDLIWVTIRNPKTLPLAKLMPADVPDGPDGEPDREASTQATYALMASLVLDWHVYDGNIELDSEPLPTPATAEHVGSLPSKILMALSDELKKVTENPQ